MSEQIKEWISNVENEKDLTVEKIDFIYDNAINYMKEIKSGFDKINQKMTLLLSYLSVVVAFLSNKILANELSGLYFLFAIITVVLYVCNIVYITFNLLNPKLSEAIYSEPQNLLNKDNMRNELTMIKFWSLHNMQTRINKLIIEQNVVMQHLKDVILFTFIAPSISILFLFSIFLFCY